MKSREATSTAPLLIPALGLLAGVYLAVGREGAAAVAGVISVLVGLVGVSGHRIWIAVGLGWCLGVGAPAIDLGGTVDPSRPVEVIGRPVGAWSRSAHGWHVPFEARTVRQGGRVGATRVVVELWIAAEARPNGRRLRARGYLRQPSEAVNGPPGPPRRWTLSVGSTRLLQVLSPEGDGSGRDLVARLRRAAERGLSVGSAEAESMARALVLGDSEALPTAWLLALRRFGLAHLIAVSGLHVGLAAAIVWFGLAAVAPQYRWGPIAAAVGLYLALVGAKPSLLRASVMSLAALGSLATERRPIALNAWAVAIAGMVCWRPRLLFDLGFQLTAAATVGLIWLSPVLIRRWRRRLPSVVATALAAGVAAHLFTLPWSVGVFSIWSPCSILLNLVAIPWTAVTLTLSVVALVGGRLPGAGPVMWWLLEQAVAPYGWLAELPVAGWASWPTILTHGSAVGIAAAIGWSLARGRPGMSVAVTLVACSLLVRGAPPQPLHFGGAPDVSDGPAAVMLDVGQGEAILLRHGGEAALIDGGGWLSPGIGGRVLLPALVRLDVRRLDAVVLTHPDRDHCGGLEEIVHLLPVEELWTSLGWESTCYRYLVGRAGLRLRPLWRGIERRVGAWRIVVLHPPPGDRSGGNERSLVLRAEAGRGSLLLTGDIGEPTERLLLERHRDDDDALAADILKLGHHGSRHSTSEAFLERVRPGVALVSAGARNSYGHPSTEVVERLAVRGIPLYRTDRGGQIWLRPAPDGGWRIDQPWRRTLP